MSIESSGPLLRSPEIIQATSPEQIEAARLLFLEYAKSLGFDLCFQNFDHEIKSLPGAYAPPSGRLLLARLENQFAGCIAFRKLENEICEMKRLYVRPTFRGHRLGSVLAQNLIAEARNIGYKKMRLDTVASAMQDAIALYRRIGFKEISPYSSIPIETALWFELAL
jgi:putative acetyltransferase